MLGSTRLVSGLMGPRVEELSQSKRELRSYVNPSGNWNVNQINQIKIKERIKNGQYYNSHTVPNSILPAVMTGSVIICSEIGHMNSDGTRGNTCI